LAAKKKSTRVAELLQEFGKLRADDLATVEALSRLLPMMSPEELKSARSQILGLAQKGQFASVRRAAWASLAIADESFDKVWSEAAAASPEALVELVAGIPQILDPDLRTRSAARVKPLVREVPAN